MRKMNNKSTPLVTPDQIHAYKNTAVLKTVMKIILRNDCENGHFMARMGLAISSTARFLGLAFFISFLFLPMEVVSLCFYFIPKCD